MAHWYYGENGQQVGPVDEATLRAAIGQGRVGAQTMVWREGMPSWLPLAQVQELSAYPVVPGGYPAPAYTPYPAYGQMGVQTSGLAVTSLVCGILGLVTCIILLGIPAVICGHMAIKQISDNPFSVGGRGMAVAGLVMGYLQLLCTLMFIVWIIVMISSQGLKF